MSSDKPKAHYQCAKCNVTITREIDAENKEPVKCPQCGMLWPAPMPSIDFTELERLQKMLAVESLLHKVELRAEYIMVEHWFIDLGKITGAYIDSGHIVLHQMGGMSLMFDNDELAGDVSGNMLSGPAFHALSDYLQERFNARELMSPVDKAFAGGNYPKERDADKASED